MRNILMVGILSGVLLAFGMLGISGASASECQQTDVCAFKTPAPRVHHQHPHHAVHAVAHPVVRTVSQPAAQACSAVIFDTTPRDQFVGMTDYIAVFSGMDPNVPVTTVVRDWAVLHRGENVIRLPCSAAYVGVLDFCFKGNSEVHQKLHADRDLRIAVQKLQAGDKRIILNPDPIHFWRS